MNFRETIELFVALSAVLLTIFGLFIRIERRLTTLESYLKFIFDELFPNGSHRRIKQDKEPSLPERKNPLL